MTYIFDERTWDVFYEVEDENQFDIWLVDDEGMELDYTELPPEDCLNVEVMVADHHHRTFSDLPLEVDTFMGAGR